MTLWEAYEAIQMFKIPIVIQTALTIWAISSSHSSIVHTYFRNWPSPTGSLASEWQSLMTPWFEFGSICITIGF